MVHRLLRMTCHLRTAFEEDTPESKKLLSRITSWSGELQGTRPFWLQKRRGLIACVKNLGSPHLFATHSTADLHLRPDGPWRVGTPAERMRIARANLRDNPLI